VRRLATVLVLGLVALGGCGGDDPPDDESQIAEAVNQWYDALAAGDGETACRLMTARGQEAMTDPYQGIGPNRPPIAATCELAVARTADSTDTNGIPEVGADEVRIRGDIAASQDSGGLCTYLRLENDAWLIAALPLPIGSEADPDTGEVPPCDL